MNRALAWLPLVAACSATPSSATDTWTNPHADGSSSSAASSSTEHGSDETAQTQASDSSGSSSAPPKLDVGDAPVDTSGAGCTKVDFLFVVDNSGSMAEEQARLVASFPEFAAAVEASVADDFHILVVDTDASFAVPQCEEICPSNPEDTCLACGGDDPTIDCLPVACDDFPPAQTCDDTLGAGRTTTPGGVACELDADTRFVTQDESDLADAFACIARVGVGASAEQPAAALVAALAADSDATPCNDGFLRDDALLVVAVISDEDDTDEDDGVVSPGTVAQWHDAVVAAKGGNEDGVVFLGLLSDLGVDGGVCQPSDPPVAAPAPRLRELAESFSRGQWASVCAGDYDPFFADVVEVVGLACDEFEPAG